MAELALLFARGALLVCAVSLQTVILARAPFTLGGGLRVVLGATTVGVIWWTNVQESVSADPFLGGLAYAVGSGCGALVGWSVARYTERRQDARTTTQTDGDQARAGHPAPHP